MRIRDFGAALLVGAALAGCDKEGCLTGDDPACVVPSPCQDLAFECEGGAVSLRVLEPGDAGLAADNPLALAAPGDILLENDQVRVVVEALDHPHYLGPTGGGIVDFGTAQESNDALRHIFTATGLLPTEAFHYTDLKTIQEDGLVAVQVNGHLDGFPDIKVATRYELRPCDPGVRVRSEVVNRTPDPQTWYVTDAWYWGGRELMAFTPGDGFEHPSFGLSTVLDAFREVPFLAAGNRAEPAASYASVACEDEALVGFQSEEITAMGRPNRVVMPRDYEVFERFHAVVDGSRISDAVDVALDIRRALFDEPYATLSGRLVTDAGPADFSELIRGSVTVVRLPDEGDPMPVTHTVPDADGTFSVRVPGEGSYRLDVDAFGRQVASQTVTIGPEGRDIGEVAVPAVGQLVISATVDGVADPVLVFVHPADEATREATEGQLLGHFEACAPLLGNPHGPSPACNRVLVEGPTVVVAPPGRYDVAASPGLFGTLGVRRSVVVAAGGTTEVTLELETLELQPEGALSADFHVHGAASFDSMIPDEDRVRAFVASRLDVIATTEHDTVWTYDRAITELGFGDRLRLLYGTESTGHILMPLIETTIYPKVIGHWNAWPLPFDAEAPYHGAPWDEEAQPGELFDRLAAQGWSPETGVVQLNHPVGGLQFGRDFGWASALELDYTKPLQARYDGSGNSMYDHVPPGATSSNADYHVQEVMNGSANLIFQQYRELWFYLLDQGYLRGGTANSDSHTLTENVLGIPRTLVYSDTTLDAFDDVAFDRAVREGRMVGTSGPVLEAWTTDRSGARASPSLLPFEPDEAGTLEITLAAAPWVPVEEVRVIVNGDVAATFPVAPVDPLGDTLVAFSASVPLAELLPMAGDAWVVVEAGLPLLENADLDCDGMPDTGDNNGDGAIDWRDVADLEEDPELDCLEDVGPPAEPPPPEPESARWYYQLVVPGGYPTAFTNPFVLDRDGGGFGGVTR